MTKSEREELRAVKGEANHAKRALLGIQRNVRRLSPRQADQLGSIIARLESWQNK